MQIARHRNPYRKRGRTPLFFHLFPRKREPVQVRCADFPFRSDIFIWMMGKEVYACLKTRPRHSPIHFLSIPRLPKRTPAPPDEPSHRQSPAPSTPRQTRYSRREREERTADENLWMQTNKFHTPVPPEWVAQSTCDVQSNVRPSRNKFGTTKQSKLMVVEHRVSPPASSRNTAITALRHDTVTNIPISACATVTRRNARAGESLQAITPSDMIACAKAKTWM